jgi:hypothetical protein
VQKLKVIEMNYKDGVDRCWYNRSRYKSSNVCSIFKCTITKDMMISLRQMSIYNAAANRTVQRLEASKYTASQGIGGAFIFS